MDQPWYCQGFNIFSPGTVYLEEKTRPSQVLSTSSDVSVKVGVEDRPLLGNRQLWPSQLFGPFETSPSDVDDDPTRFFKRIVDGDEDSNRCDRFGEVSISRWFRYSGWV